MHSKGLLIIDSHGQKFLLVPEEGVEAGDYTLSVRQRQEDQWVRLQPASSRKLRESMLGALLEFFGNLCRILNRSSHCTDRIKRITPKYVRLKGTQPSDITTAPIRRPGQQPGKTASKQSSTLNDHELNL